MLHTCDLKGIVKDSFGGSITTLFSAICGHNKNLLLDDHKEMFFEILEYLLTVGSIKFLRPSVDCYISPSNPYPKYTINDSDAHWNEEPQEIVKALKINWPTNALNDNDFELISYFYELPAIIWVKDGKFFAS